VHVDRPRNADLQILARRNRSAFAITDTELKVIAAAAIMGLRSTPAARGVCRCGADVCRCGAGGRRCGAGERRCGADARVRAEGRNVATHHP